MHNRRDQRTARPSLRTFRWVLGIVVALSLAATPAGAADAAPVVTRPAAVLITGWHNNHELAARLEKDGFTLNALGYPGLDGPALTWDQLQKYNVIVVAGLGLANADGTLSDKIKGNLELLNRFLNEGGGILFIPVWGQTKTGIPPQDAFAKPLGLTALFEEVLFDPDTSVGATAWKIDFAHTDNIVKNSPLTAGVKSLWYPVATRAGDQQHTTTFIADKDWDVVVRGSKTSCARLVPFETLLNLARDGHYASAVPLVASRTVGKGRLVCLGITPEYLFSDVGLTTLERIVYDRGLKNIPSDGFILVRNALRWLAEPSLEAGRLGGATMEASLLRDPTRTNFGSPYDWQKGDQCPAPLPAFPGVIGARTALSSGKGTVADWVAKAKTQKLTYLVFLEEFAKLSPEKFAELKKQCARLTTPEFAAIPGFTIDDEVGNHYFYFGTAFPYPEKKFLTPDGTVFTAFAPEASPKDPHLKGQLAMTTLLYSYSDGAFKLTAGNFLFNHDAAPFVDFFSDWDATAVVTTRGGETLDDATRGFLSLVDSGQTPVPLAINLMSDPAELAQCRWQTVLCLDPSGASAVGDTLFGSNKVAAYWSTWHAFPDNPARAYISSGPQIVRWAHTGCGDYGGDNRGDFVWQNYRWKLNGLVKSAVGLQEVAVYDGPELFRRFLPQGAKEFEFTLDLTHDKQHNLVLIATDVAGGRAISSEKWDRNHRLEELQCGDRNNQLSYGYSTTKAGYGLQLGGNQGLATPNKRIDEKTISPAGTFRNDALLGTPAFDGGTGGEPRFYTPVMLRTDKGEIAPPTVSESFRLLQTGDVNIGEGHWTYDFTDHIPVFNVWHTLWKTEPATDFVVRKQNAFFNVDPDSPLAVFLWTIKVTLRRDLPNNGVAIGFLSGAEAQLWAVHGSDQSFAAGYWRTDDRSNSRNLVVPFARGAYAAALDSPLGGAAVFSLTDGLQFQMGLPDALHRLNFNLPAAQTPQKKDQTGEISLLLVGIPRATDYTRQIAWPTTEIVERFRREFGLAGGPPGYTLKINNGRLLGQRYILDLDGRSRGCFSGTLAGDLVSSLPIRVAGLHDRWSAFLYDRALQKARPLGVFENRAWAMVKLHGRLDLFVGHPILCNRPELFIQVTQTAANGWSIEVHNPTDRAIRAKLQRNPAFDPFQDKKLKDPAVEVPAGQSITRSL